MKKHTYPAVFDYADDGISVSFPDLPGCFTCGKTDAEALSMAKDALGGHLLALNDSGCQILKPTESSNVKLSNGESLHFIEVFI